MAGSPRKPPPPASAAGSSSPKPPPPPFNSHPSYEELVDSHLRNRVVSGTRVDFIHEADLYSADPNQLTENHPPATASNGERAWYFFTPLRPKGAVKNRMKRNVDTGREGSWVSSGRATNEPIFSGQRPIGSRMGFAFEEKKAGGGKSKRAKSAWRMMEFRLDPDEGGQEAGSPDLLVLSKVYRGRVKAGAADESSMAAAKADAEAPAASAALTRGREGVDEVIGAETTAAGPGRKKRKAGGRDSGAAETAAASRGRRKKADGESADATEEAEQKQEPRDPRDRPQQLHDFFPDSQNP